MNIISGTLLAGIARAIGTGFRIIKHGLAGTGKAITTTGRAIDGKKTYLGTILGIIVVTLELAGIDVPGVEAVDENWLAMYIGLGIIAALRHAIRKLE